jgi:hypothetical protein
LFASSRWPAFIVVVGPFGAPAVEFPALDQGVELGRRIMQAFPSVIDRFKQTLPPSVTT